MIAERTRVREGSILARPERDFLPVFITENKGLKRSEIKVQCGGLSGGYHKLCWKSQQIKGLRAEEVTAKLVLRGWK